jgi:serine/threonine protein kinase
MEVRGARAGAGDDGFFIPYGRLSNPRLVKESDSAKVFRATMGGYQDVAVKQLKFARLSEKAKQELLAFVERLRNLRCDFVVGLQYAVLDPPCLVLQWMERGSLRQVLLGGQALSWPQRLQLALDVSKGMTFLHELPEVHGNLRSSNVFVDKHGTAKIGNFGLAGLRAEVAQYRMQTLTADQARQQQANPDRFRTAVTLPTNLASEAIRWLAPGAANTAQHPHPGGGCVCIRHHPVRDCRSLRSLPR